MNPEPISPGALLGFAASRGYSYACAEAALATLADDRADGSTYWDARGMRALLDAHAAIAQPTAPDPFNCHTRKY